MGHDHVICLYRLLGKLASSMVTQVTVNPGLLLQLYGQT